MSNKELNSVEQDSKENNSSLNQPGSRRKFFKKAAIGSALITTVTSRSALAASCSISGNLSNNGSAQEFQKSCEFKGYSADVWNDNWNTLSQEIGINNNIKVKNLLDTGNNNSKVKKKIDPDDDDNLKDRLIKNLNARLWEAMQAACENDSNCEYFGTNSPIHQDFYYFTRDYVGYSGVASSVNSLTTL